MNKRAYSMETRSRQAEATRQRVLDAARALFLAESSGFTLEGVAAAAGTSVQTVLRVFGSKEALTVAAIGTFRNDHRSVAVPGSPRGAVRQIFDDYERIGDRVIHMLGEEHRVAGLAEAARSGREKHRLWVETAFAPELRRRRGRQKEKTLTALVVATDVYLWKVLRRDQGLDRSTAEAIMVLLVEGVLATTHKGRNQ